MPKQLSHPELQKNSPIRPPDWRWRRATWLVSQGRNYSRCRDDEGTGRAVRYLRHLARGRGRHVYRHIHAARLLHEDGGNTRLLVQARILARQTSAEIEQLTDVPEEVVNAYEHLFFHVGDRIQSRDWVLAQAIGANMASESPITDRGALLKLFAYFGGRLVLDGVLRYLIGDKNPLEPVQDLSTPEGRLDQIIRLGIALHLLPWSTNSQKTQLLKVMLTVREMEQNRRQGPASPTVLAKALESKIHEALAKMACDSGNSGKGWWFPMATANIGLTG
jgi:hypothetical protein